MRSLRVVVVPFALGLLGVARNPLAVSALALVDVAIAGGVFSHCG